MLYCATCATQFHQFLEENLFAETLNIPALPQIPKELSLNHGLTAQSMAVRATSDVEVHFLRTGLSKSIKDEEVLSTVH